MEPRAFDENDLLKKDCTVVGYPWYVEDKKQNKSTIQNEMYAMNGRIKEIVDEGNNHQLISYHIDTTEG